MLIASARQKIENSRQLLAGRTDLLYSRMKERISEARSTVEKAMIMIRESDPRNIFRKGYAAVTQDGSIIPDAASVRAGEEYEIRMRDGSFIAAAKEVRESVVEAILSSGEALPVIFEERVGKMWRGHSDTFVTVEVECDGDMHGESRMVLPVSRKNDIIIGKII
jgi:hypothetical protein